MRDSFDESNKYRVGQIIRHKKFNYRGVIVEVDSSYRMSDSWYEKLSAVSSPKASPWYRVLVDNASHETYVAESHISEESAPEPITHPCIGLFFDTFSCGRYQCRRPLN